MYARVFAASLFALMMVAAVADDSGSYSIDSSHSFALFRVKHFGVSFVHGRFNAVSGKIVLDEKDASKNAVEVVIKTDSVDTGIDARDKHLKTADFFDTAKFAEMTFKSTAFKSAGGDKFQITGDLTLHGVTQSVTVEATHIGSGPGRTPSVRLIGFESVFTIKRGDFGMATMLGPVGDDVTITIGVEASAGAAAK